MTEWKTERNDLKNDLENIERYAGSCAKGAGDPEFAQFLKIENLARYLRKKLESPAPQEE